MKKSSKFFLSLLGVAVLTVGTLFLLSCTSFSTKRTIEARALKNLEYCKSHNLSTDYCFLVDFSIHSGKDRFFIWDYNKGKIVYSDVCAHGRGGGSTHLKAEFSNTPSSHCSSLGKYKVSGYGHMSKRPKVPMLILDGLESTNSNARSRGILIHPSAVQFKTYPVPIPYLTYGCFGVSESGFNCIKGCVDSQKKKILLDAFCSE